MLPLIVLKKQKVLQKSNTMAVLGTSIQNITLQKRMQENSIILYGKNPCRYLNNEWKQNTHVWALTCRIILCDKSQQIAIK